MSTYDKLGQYATTELPIAPSNVVITAVGSTTADLEWTSNYTTSGTIILQLWMTNYWLTKNEIDISSTSSTITDLPAGESWRIRVAVLLNGVIYPCQPVLNEVVIPYPENLAVGDKTVWTAAFSWDGNDESWTNVKFKVSTGDSVYETITTLPASATTYTATGYTMSNNEARFIVCAEIDGSDYCTSESYAAGTIGGAAMWVGGTAIWDMWNTWDDSKGNAQEIQKKNDYEVFRYYKENVTLYENGTFTIRVNRDGTIPPETYPEFLYADMPNTSANITNDGGLFKFTGANGNYNILIDFPNKAVTITAV
jgi:hypothetical protein